MSSKPEMTKAEYDAMLKSFRRMPIDDELLDSVTGGNDGKPKDGKKNGVEWDCPFCGAHLYLTKFEDGPKHMTQECPNNPFK